MAMTTATNCRMTRQRISFCERFGEPPRILDRGMVYLSPPALADDRIGGGHPEGIFESWATMYERFARAIEAANEGRAPDPGLRYPDAAAGVSGVRWVENCVRSADAGGIWIDYA